MDELSPVPLSLQSLSALPEPVARPRYERRALSPGIVHIGVGNFHRAHMAVYLDRLFNAGLGLDWAVIGAGVTAHDARMRAALAPQDWLSTVVEQSATSSAARITGVMCDFIDPDDRAGLRATLTDPAIRLVSLTVTEGGYFIDPATGRFDPTAPDIRADVAAPHDPRTAFGMIVAALAERRAAGTAPFTVLSCDNLPHNGDVVRAVVVGLAQLWPDPGLADWIDAQVTFPNSMVDRIATATGARERALVRSVHGIGDQWPVFCEDYLQWVLEDRFCAGRPPFEQAGVSFVADVAPYETLKIRVLNGGHALIAYPAGLLGIHFVHEAMAHPLIRDFLDRVIAKEVIPTLPPVPGIEPARYFRLIEERFANPKIGDTVQRLCLDGSNRQPKFIVPTLAAQLAQGGPVSGLALASALWCRYCAGVDEQGATIPANDPQWEALVPRALAARDDPAQWLEQRAVYGDLARSPAFAQAFGTALNSLWQHGTEATLRTWLAREG